MRITIKMGGFLRPDGVVGCAEVNELIDVDLELLSALDPVSFAQRKASALVESIFVFCLQNGIMGRDKHGAIRINPAVIPPVIIGGDGSPK
jgi:hypothetical protein